MKIILWNLGLMIFAGSMIMACIMDLREQMVYRFVWLIAGLAAVLLIVLHDREYGLGIDIWVEYILFVVIQYFWFSRFYGRADCHAFCVCAAVMLANGMGLKDWLIHMLFTFFGLSVVQLIRCNIRTDGRLKKPVPLIPYITVALGLWVDFKCGKWYI